MGVGGLSGPALKPIALAAVYACANAVELPIVGMGGVATGRDALELLAVGASDVALGTVLFSDPFAPTRIRVELEAAAAATGVDDPDNVHGAAQKIPAKAQKTSRLTASVELLVCGVPCQR